MAKESRLGTFLWPVATTLAAIRASGKTHVRGWFWAAVVPVACVHVLLILRVPWWPSWVPTPILIVFAVGDLLMIFCFLSFLAKAVGREAFMRKRFTTSRKMGN